MCESGEWNWIHRKKQQIEQIKRKCSSARACHHRLCFIFVQLYSEILYIELQPCNNMLPMQRPNYFNNKVSLTKLYCFWSSHLNILIWRNNKRMFCYLIASLESLIIVLKEKIKFNKIICIHRVTCVNLEIVVDRHFCLWYVYMLVQMQCNWAR